MDATQPRLPGDPATLPPGVRLPARLRLSSRADTETLPDTEQTTLVGRRAWQSSLLEAVRRVWARPKVELHLHLEGTLRPETVSDLAQRYAPEAPFARPGWHHDYWTFRDLAGFIQEFGSIGRTCIRTADDFGRVARECFEDLAAQQVSYAEVSFSPRQPDSPTYVPLDDMIAAIDQARREVEAQTPLRVGLIIGINRHLVPLQRGDPDAGQLAQAFIAEALRARDAGAQVVGIDLHGDEQTAPHVTSFVGAYRAAAEAGLGRRAHAGEGAGPEVVRASLDELGVQRIAHGVRAVEDPTLVRHLAESGIPLDVCPTSNVLMGLAPTLAAHAVRSLHDAGVIVTISSDDPIVFETSVTTELALLHHVHAFAMADLGALNARAARASFMPPQEREALAQAVERGWQNDPA